MPDPIAYKNLILDTTINTPTLNMGHDGRIDTNVGVALGVSWTDNDVVGIKIWGTQREISKSYEIATTTDTVTIADKPAAIGSVTVNAQIKVVDTDYSYDAETGEITFTSDLSANDIVEVSYIKGTTVEGDISDFTPITVGDTSYSTTVDFPAVTGNVTVYAKLIDNVGNISLAGSIQVYLDIQNPVVAIESLTANSLTPPKISKVTGKDTATLIWSCDEDFVAYKVCVVSATDAAQNAGVIIPSTAGSTNVEDLTESVVYHHPSGSPITTTIKGADLETASSGDGSKIIKVFVKDQSGHWSI